MKAFTLLINLLFLGAVTYGLWKRNRLNPLRRFFWPALLLKFTAGIGLGVLYMYYYSGGDTFLFFEDGKKLAEYARNDFFAYIRFLCIGDESFEISSQLVYSQYRALFMVKVTSIFNLITFDNYWITTAYFSLVSFICAWTLVKAIAESYPPAREGGVVAFLFFPSVVFWSSGLIKESLAMAALFFLSMKFIKAWMNQKLQWWEWCVVAASAWFLWSLKYYYLAVFLPVAFAALITHRLYEIWKPRHNSARVLLWCIAFFIPVTVISSLHPNFHPQEIFEVIVSNNREFNSLSDPEDLIKYDHLEPTIGGILKNVPTAVISGIFRPLPWEAHTLFQWIIAIENLFLLVLFFAALGNILRLMRSRERLLLFSIILYVGALCAFLALSTPNFGTLSRYRISFLPFFFLLITIENPLLKRLMGFKQR